MKDQELQQLIIDTGIMLNLESDQLKFLDLAINMAYNKGHLDGSRELATKLVNKEETI